MIYYIFLICDFQIIVSEVFCRSIAIFASYFPNHLLYLFWHCVTINFSTVISTCISFGVFDDFSGFSLAVFISV